MKKTNIQKSILPFALVLLSFFQLKAQLQVQTQILPPYSPYLTDYVTYQNKVAMNIINPGMQTYQVRLQGKVSGNGINVSIPTNFKPANPLIVMPGTNKFTGNQLSPYFDGNNLIYSGITLQEIVSGNGLPEGNYTFCFWAVDYNTGQQLSPPNSGCATIKITHFEVPKIINPACNAEVAAKTPQNMVFNWSMPAGVNPLEVAYELTIAEMFPQQLNPNQAMDVATEPIFFRKTVNTNTYVFTIADPKLEEGKKYAWRVRAMPKQAKKLNFKNNGFSLACAFTYKSAQQNQNPPPPPQDDDNCFADCNHPAPKNQILYKPAVNDVISIGKFMMTVTAINNAKGQGVIQIPFLKTKLAVTFENLQVNSEKQAIGNSKVTGRIDNNSLVPQAMANDKDGILEASLSQMNQLSDYINQGQKLVSQFVPDMEPVGVPFALDNNGFNLNIVGIIFTPANAYMNMLFGYDIPEAINNEFLDFSQKGLCIRPNGFGPKPNLALKTDQSIKLSDHVEMVFYKGEATSVVLTCKGIESIKVNGAFEISREKLLPVQNGTIVQGNQKVKATFNATLNSGFDWIVSASMVPATFTLPDAKDLILTASNITLDQSAIENTNGMQFHSNHPKNNGFNKDWKGLLIGNFSIQFPEGFNKGNNKMSLETEKVLIDKTGLWLYAAANNLVKINEGDVAGWKFSVKTLSVDIQASSFAGGGLSGDIQLPIAETGLGYSAILQKGNSGLNYEFLVETQSEIEANLWLAKINLVEGSTINIAKVNNIVKPMAVLNGTISIGFAKSPDQQTALSNLALNGIKFQELKITGGAQKPEINLQFVALNNQPGGVFSMNKFPINLTGLAYDNGANPGIQFGIKLNLSGGSNAFEAKTDLKIKAKWDAGVKRFTYDGIDLQEISINADLGIMEVVGKVNLYKEHQTYGTGFRGDLAATLKFAAIAINATVQMGKIGSGNAVEETASNYRYFFIDIGARWGVGGLPIPGVGAVAFYGFGGGIYRNMNRAPSVAVTNNKISDKQGPGTMTPGESRSGVTYTPKKGTFGFMASVTLGTTGEPTSFNADLKLTVQFNTDNFGVTKVLFDGDAYVMGPITNRDQKLVKIKVAIESDFEKPMFHASITVDGGTGFDNSKLNVKATVKVGLNIHFEPSLWYIKLGEWTNDDEPWNDPSRIQVDIELGAQVAKVGLNFNAYFMMGNDIGDLPRSPLKVRQVLGLEGKPQMPKPLDTKVFLGKGFALGAGVRLTADVNFFVFYANMELILGADVLLSKTTATCNGNMNYGINGWYAKGIAYAYLHGDVGLRLKLWSFEGKFSLMEFTGAAQMKAELPNPNWIQGNFAVSGSVLNGMIKVNTKFGFEVGSKCQWGEKAADELPIISEILPENNTDGSVFEAPQAAFNFEVSKKGNVRNTFTVKDYSKKKKGENRTFSVEIDKAELKLGNAIVSGQYHLNTGSDGLTFIPDKTLEEQKDYTFTIVAKAYEKKDNKWTVLKTESKSVKFKTGIKPDYIHTDNVIKAYPQIGQRYFLAQDEPKGDITVGLDQCYLFDKKEDKNFKYEYKLRLVNLETKQSIEVPFICSGKNFSYNMPANLARETVYEIKFLRIAKSKQAPANTKANTAQVYKDEKGNVIQVPKNSGNKFGNLPAKINNAPNNKGQGMANKGMNLQMNVPQEGSKLMVRHNTIKAEQVSGQSMEKELFAYYFRTSKHAKSSEKYEAYKTAGTAGQQNYSQTLSIGGVQYTYPTTIKFPLLQGQENMDIYDAYGYYKENFNILVQPLASTYLVWGNNTYFNNLNTRVYEHRYKNQGQRTSNTFAFNRYAKGNHIFFGLDKQLFDRLPIQAMKVWHSATEGPINIAANQALLQPKGRLTQNEINKAKQGQKVVEIYPKNPVLPLNIYLPAVALLDGVAVYNNHRSRCFDDHVLKKNENSCIDDHAKKALTFLPNTGGFPNYNAYNLTPGLNYTFKITYGYNAAKPFTKELNFKP